ncbi:MAG TPA: hypothetical protein VHG32_05385, partial [Thermoanaerobaculia bacterium]|nr:hypothetical protein [Thermoanaerobaculia bacterium]
TSDPRSKGTCWRAGGAPAPVLAASLLDPFDDRRSAPVTAANDLKNHGLTMAEKEFRQTMFGIQNGPCR